MQGALLKLNIVNIHSICSRNFRSNANMNRSKVAIYLLQHSNLEGLIKPHYCQYPLYLYPLIFVETSIWSVVALPSKQYSILIQRALLNVNIVNIHSICTLKFSVKLQYEP
jgi:hypothetical protein